MHNKKNHRSLQYFNPSQFDFWEWGWKGKKNRLPSLPHQATVHSVMLCLWEGVNWGTSTWRPPSRDLYHLWEITPLPHFWNPGMWLECLFEITPCFLRASPLDRWCPGFSNQTCGKLICSFSCEQWWECRLSLSCPPPFSLSFVCDHCRHPSTEWYKNHGHY